ncbi:MAG: hypothetical protein GYB50_20390 [Rhodobacteraceae bacterium]|nr:hypothetical protein [Paracoccaceae bacterium]
MAKSKELSAEALAVVALVKTLEQTNPGFTERFREALENENPRLLYDPVTQGVLDIANAL